MAESEGEGRRGCTVLSGAVWQIGGLGWAGCPMGGLPFWKGGWPQRGVVSVTFRLDMRNNLFSEMQW